MQRSGGSDLNLKMDSAETNIPDGVLSLLNHLNSKLTIDFETFACTLDGSEMDEIPDSLDKLDLGLSMEKDKVISTKFEGHDAYQLHFNHSGPLPCPVEYKIKAEGKKRAIRYIYIMLTAKKIPSVRK